MTADPTPTPATPEPLAVRWDGERCEGRGAVVIGDGKWGASVTVLVPTDTPFSGFTDLVTSSLAAALTPPPTGEEIADHLNAGTHRLERWVTTTCAWVALDGDDPDMADWWGSDDVADPTAPQPGYRLVPLPPEPSYEVVEVPWWEARGEVFAEEVGGKHHSIVFVCDGESGGPTVSLSNGYIARASDGGTVPVRQERKS